MGLSALGHDVVYLEQADAYPSCYDPRLNKCVETPDYGLAFASDAFERLGLRDCWAFINSAGEWIGPQRDRIRRLAGETDVCLNISGANSIPASLRSVPVRILIDTDPAFTQIRHLTDPDAIERARQHNAFFTFAENLPANRSSIPDDGLPWQATRQPVVLDAWPVLPAAAGAKYTSVMLWESYDALEYEGRRYGQKSESFGPYLDLPVDAGRHFQLAIGSSSAPGEYLESLGWDVINPLQPTRDPWTYQHYIQQSKGEFGIAKHGYVVSHSGWFSERSAAYMASGRPVIVQDTGFTTWLPSGEGVLPFTNRDSALCAIEEVNRRYEHHCQAARDAAAAYFDSNVVLTELLTGALSQLRRWGRLDDHAFPPPLVLTPVSRRPTQLPADTVATVMADRSHLSIRVSGSGSSPAPRVSIVVVTADNLVFLKLCVASILANTHGPTYEIVIVDNGSSDGTAAYLAELMSRQPHVHRISNLHNRGFGPATNQGLGLAKGDVLVLLNDDTIVPSGWLSRLCAHIEDPSIGLLGPVTNRSGNDCQIQTSYATYGEFLQLARQREASGQGALRDVAMLTMFCLAMRRDVLDRLGLLDEQFAIGMFEDDDYAMRARQAGLRIVCAEDVFVHHFGATSLGRLAANGRLGTLFEANRRRFEEKWQVNWVARRTRVSPEYEQLVDRIRAAIGQYVPPASRVAVVSRGDDALLDLPGCTGTHFPRMSDGSYAGFHPANSDEAIAHVTDVSTSGEEYLLIPATMRWWLEFYGDFAAHLRRSHRLLADTESFVLFSLNPDQQLSHPDAEHLEAFVPGND
jgi:GT2 family glycosyltransferase